MPDLIRIVLVDDHPLFREGVAHTLNAANGFEVVGQGASADEALELARELLPDLILLDVDMPGDGISVVPAIGASCPVTKIVMLTVSAADDDVLRALKAGAHGYVLKGVSSRELVEILKTVVSGEVWVTPQLAASLLMEMTGRTRAQPPAEDPLSELTWREREILQLVAAGKSNKEAGLELHLTEKTVKHYMTNILQKLQVRNRVEASILARRFIGQQEG